MFKLVIFDLDGPILDSFGRAKISVFKTRERLIKQKIVEKQKLPFPKKETFILNWGYPGLIAIRKMFPQLSELEAWHFVKNWAQNEREKKLTLIKGAKTTLSWLKRENFLCALLTTRSHNLDFHLKRLKVEKYFDFFQSFENPALPKIKVHPNHIFHPSPKDHPSFFEKILSWAQQKKISKREMIFVDDTLAGLRLTKILGIPFVGVCTGPMGRKDWQRYGNLDQKYVIKSVAQLPSWLESFKKRV